MDDVWSEAAREAACLQSGSEYMQRPMTHIYVARDYYESALTRLQQAEAQPVCAACGKCPVDISSSSSSEGGATLLQSLRKCSACKSVAYCGAECQRLGWRQGHKKECKERASAKEYWVRMASGFLSHSREVVDVVGAFITGTRLGLGEGGDPRDAELAVRLYQLAAASTASTDGTHPEGHPNAQVYLALHYERGDGVKQDSKKALGWYSRALSQRGHLEGGKDRYWANTYMQRLYEQGCCGGGLEQVPTHVPTHQTITMPLAQPPTPVQLPGDAAATPNNEGTCSGLHFNPSLYTVLLGTYDQQCDLHILSGHDDVMRLVFEYVRGWWRCQALALYHAKAAQLYQYHEDYHSEEEDEDEGEGEGR